MGAAGVLSIVLPICGSGLEACNGALVYMAPLVPRMLVNAGDSVRFPSVAQKPFWNNMLK